MRIPADISQRADLVRPGLLNLYVFWSIPVLVLGLWQLGQFLPAHQLTASSVSTWEAGMIRTLATGMRAGAGPSAALLITLFFMSRLAVAVMVSFAWAWLFARLRGRPMDAGWFHLAWWFTLLMPVAVPIPYLALGLSFGLVFGCHAFGGTGRYIVNPSLLGAVFLSLSWPAAINDGWLPGTEAVPTWERVVTEGPAAMLASGTGWRELTMGGQLAAPGAMAAGATLVIALLLIFAGLVPWRVIAGGLAAICIAGLGFDEPPWHWQPVLGGFCFALVFIATDPTTRPESRAGCWALGIAFGSLAIVMRMLNPGHPEATLQALLLAMLLTPLVDHFAKRAGRRGEIR